jgi:hypothetical protein
MADSSGVNDEDLSMVLMLVEDDARSPITITDAATVIICFAIVSLLLSYRDQIHNPIRNHPTALLAVAALDERIPNPSGACILVKILKCVCLNLEVSLDDKEQIVSFTLYDEVVVLAVCHVRCFKHFVLLFPTEFCPEAVVQSLDAVGVVQSDSHGVASSAILEELQ